jgi:hypothetical protein
MFGCCYYFIRYCYSRVTSSLWPLCQLLFTTTSVMNSVPTPLLSRFGKGAFGCFLQLSSPPFSLIVFRGLGDDRIGNVLYHNRVKERIEL